MIHIDTNDAFPVVSFYGEFDLANVGEIDQTLSAYDATPVLIVSLEEAMFIDSSVLGVLVRCYNRRSGQLVFIVAQASAVYRLFAITALIEHFSVKRNRTEALRQAVRLREGVASSSSRDGVAMPVKSD